MHHPGSMTVFVNGEETAQSRPDDFTEEDLGPTNELAIYMATDHIKIGDDTYIQDGIIHTISCKNECQVVFSLIKGMSVEGKLAVLNYFISNGDSGHWIKLSTGGSATLLSKGKVYRTDKIWSTTSLKKKPVEPVYTPTCQPYLHMRPPHSPQVSSVGNSILRSSRSSYCIVKGISFSRIDDNIERAIDRSTLTSAKHCRTFISSETTGQAAAIGLRRNDLIFSLTTRDSHFFISTPTVDDCSRFIGSNNITNCQFRIVRMTQGEYADVFDLNKNTDTLVSQDELLPEQRRFIIARLVKMYSIPGATGREEYKEGLESLSDEELLQVHGVKNISWEKIGVM